jgi:hypothetical protein
MYKGKYHIVLRIFILLIVSLVGAKEIVSESMPQLHVEHKLEQMEEQSENDYILLDDTLAPAPVVSHALTPALILLHIILFAVKKVFQPRKNSPEIPLGGFQQYLTRSISPQAP